ncbi:MAG: hypothetical protein NTV01_06635 [Bacteroidia bacterium]|nr:hypothetical protein [Bacteroidia bacterium]
MVVLGLFIVWFFNTETITRQGINYKVRAIKIPLYVKVHNFIDRHLNYQWTIDQIVNDKMTDQQKAETIFQWTIQHILKQPPQLPVVDDHPWNIIVRGYGMADQMADVFAVLSHYAGLKSFILDCKGPIGSDPPYMSLGAVYFDGAWHLCDLYRQTIFLNKKNQWASTSELVASGWKAKCVGNASQCGGNIPYENYFKKLNEVDFETLSKNHRSSIQTPLSRFRFFLKDRKI